MQEFNEYSNRRRIEISERMEKIDNFIRFAKMYNGDYNSDEFQLKIKESNLSNEELYQCSLGGYLQHNNNNKLQSYLNKVLSINSEFYSYGTSVKQNLNPFLLNPKYDFLKPFLTFFSSSVPCLQLNIFLSNDKELNFLKKLTQFYQKNNLQIDGVYYKTLGMMGCGFVRKKIDPLTLQMIELGVNCDDEIISKYHHYQSNICKEELKIEKIDDLKNLNKIFRDYIIELFNKSNDLNLLKRVVTQYIFGVDIDDRFLKYNVLKEITKDNKSSKIIEITEAMCSIYELNSKEDLIQLFNNFINQSIEIKDSIKFSLLNLFSSYFAMSIKKEGNELLKKQGKIIDGTKIIDGGINFQMLVHVVGAFNFRNIDNCNRQNWENKIGNNFICCTVIDNSNICPYDPNNNGIIMGFKNIDSLSMKGTYIKDANSNEFASLIPRYYSYIPKKIIDNSRDFHNEVRILREINKNEKNERVKPDYLVYIEETLDSEINFPKFKKYLEISKEFDNIPIIIINREKCLINESAKTAEIIKKYYETNDIQLILDFITIYGNNTNGMRGSHQLLKSKYFLKENFKSIMLDVLKSIDSSNVELIIDKLKNEMSNAERNSYDKTFDLEYPAIIKAYSDKIDKEYSDKINTEYSNPLESLFTQNKL